MNKMGTLVTTKDGTTGRIARINNDIAVVEFSAARNPLPNDWPESPEKHAAEKYVTLSRQYLLRDLTPAIDPFQGERVLVGGEYVVAPGSAA